MATAPSRRERLLTAGDWLRSEREGRGLSQKQFAALVGVSNGSVSSYERGVSAPTADSTCEQIARVLGKSTVEVRRRFGLYVPPDAEDGPPAPPSVLEAIFADRTLLPEAKEHLVRQYALLQRLQAAEPSALQKDMAEHAAAFDQWERDETVRPASTATDQAPDSLGSPTRATE